MERATFNRFVHFLFVDAIVNSIAQSRFELITEFLPESGPTAFHAIVCVRRHRVNGTLQNVSYRIS